MSGHWYSPIQEDLERVETVMRDTVRSDNPKLNEVCNYVLSVNGKRIRPAMCILSFKACGGNDPKKAIDVGTALEIIHNATLVHDDINDQGDLRRGAKAAYKQFSISRSIVAGDYLFALGFRMIGSSSGEIVDYLVDASSAMCEGEFDQKDFERNIDVKESDYMKIIDGKTARLIECAAKSGAFLANTNLEVIDAVGTFAYNVGIAFQIIDDTLDIIGDERSTGKNVGSDIMEGKPTLPMIYALQDRTHGASIRKIFEMESPEWSDVNKAIELIKKTDSIKRCVEKARGIVNEAMGLLDFLEDTPYKRSLMDLAQFIVERDR